MTRSDSHAHPRHGRRAPGRLADVLGVRLAGRSRAQLRLCYADSLHLRPPNRVQPSWQTVLGLRTPLRRLSTPPCGDAVAFGYPVVPRLDRTWTFTSFRHVFGLARSGELGFAAVSGGLEDGGAAARPSRRLGQSPGGNTSAPDGRQACPRSLSARSRCGLFHGTA